MQKKWGVIVLFAVAGFLRLWNLGYSDYQGDEIKALYNPKEVSSIKFFLDQRKGPVQFLVTAGLKTFSPDYRNRLLLRLPFALAGFGSVVLFYFVVKDLFGGKLAFYSTIFFATNGFLIAFSRIIQYQSLVIFFGLFAIYLVQRYTLHGYRKRPDSTNQSHHSRYLVWGFVSWAISILSHYDGVFFAPIILAILFSAWNNTSKMSLPGPYSPSLDQKTFLKHIIVSLLVFTALTSFFYIPFAFNIAQSTADYWAGHISGDVSGKISSSGYLFSVYQPIYALRIYTILGALGFVLTSVLVLFKLLPKVVKKFLKIAFILNTFSSTHLPYHLPVLLGISMWLLIPFLALEVVISIPGTHIYTYLVPLLIVMGFAVYHLELAALKVISKTGSLLKLPIKLVAVSSRLVIPLGVWLIFCFLALQSYYIFVDHAYEYPWENKKFLLWTLPKPSSIYHLSLFGFPYYRHWVEIGDFVKSDDRSNYYSTNERTTMTEYYIDLKKDSKKMGYYIYIHRPQKLIDGLDNKRVIRYAHENIPARTYSNNGRIVSEVYLLPENSPSISEGEFERYGITSDVD